MVNSEIMNFILRDNMTLLLSQLLAIVMSFKPHECCNLQLSILIYRYLQLYQSVKVSWVFPGNTQDTQV